MTEYAHDVQAEQFQTSENQLAFLSFRNTSLADCLSYHTHWPICRFWRHELWDDIRSGATTLGRGSSVKATLLP